MFQRTGKVICGSFRCDLIYVEGLLTIGQRPDYPSAQGNSNWVFRRETGVDIEGASHPEWHCIYLPVHQHPCLQKHSAMLLGPLPRQGYAVQTCSAITTGEVLQLLPNTQDIAHHMLLELCNELLNEWTLL